MKKCGKKVCGMRDKKATAFDEEIVSLARTFSMLQEQSCLALKPIVDDCCRRLDSVDQNELEHVFDSVLDISCCVNGKRLFDRLCKTFRSRYPDCVKDYIGFDHEMWGEEGKR